MTSAWAGWSRFDIPLNRYGGVHSLLFGTSTLGLLPVTRLASREILVEPNIKRQTGPALYVFSLLDWNTLCTDTCTSMYKFGFKLVWYYIINK